MKHKNTLLCIGLDSDMEKIPASLQGAKTPQYMFNKEIIKQTHEYVCAYKINSAFYEARGADGIMELKMTFDYLKNRYKDIPVILDAKRADIGNTNKGYVRFAFDYLGADAITLHPYLGHEALKPFLERKDRGCIILCKTSNPGAGELQDLAIHGKPLHEIIADKVAHEWNTQKNCLLVVGATYPEELSRIRSIVGDLTILIPGIGTQGGDIKKVLKSGLNMQKTGIIIHSSRGIIFASGGTDFALKARDAAIELQRHINGQSMEE